MVHRSRPDAEAVAVWTLTSLSPTYGANGTITVRTLHPLTSRAVPVG